MYGTENSAVYWFTAQCTLPVSTRFVDKNPPQTFGRPHYLWLKVCSSRVILSTLVQPIILCVFRTDSCISKSTAMRGRTVKVANRYISMNGCKKLKYMTFIYIQLLFSTENCTIHSVVNLFISTPWHGHATQNIVHIVQQPRAFCALYRRITLSILFLPMPAHLYQKSDLRHQNMNIVSPPADISTKTCLLLYVLKMLLHNTLSA